MVKQHNLVMIQMMLHFNKRQLLNNAFIISARLSSEFFQRKKFGNSTSVTMAHQQSVSPNGNDNILHNGEAGESSDDSNNELFQAMEVEMQQSTHQPASKIAAPQQNPLDTIPYSQSPSTYNKILSVDSIASASPSPHQNVPTNSNVINVTNLFPDDKTKNTKFTKISIILCIILLFYSVFGVTYLLMESISNNSNCGCSSSESQQLTSSANNDGNNGNNDIMYNTTLVPSYNPSESPVTLKPSSAPSISVRNISIIIRLLIIVSSD